ncbi:MAG TPA: ABC transporter permease [Acidimicrobiales bacterium]|nr:ABC transporter permease [Acidimicrobiales bacterium]
MAEQPWYPGEEQAPAPLRTSELVEAADKPGLMSIATPVQALEPLVPGLENGQLPQEAPAGTRYEGGEALSSGSVLRLTFGTFIENKLAIAGLLIIVLLVLFCFVGPHIYITNQKTVNPLISNYGPSPGHLLGTDGEGFDVLGRLMVAGQSSIEVGMAAGLAAAIFGTLYGAISAVIGGIVDAVMMRVVDALFSLPTLFLLILLSAIFTPNLPLMILVLTFVAWLGPARLVRGEALTLRTREYVQAVKVAGGTRARIVVRHIVPNAIGTIMVNTSFLIADAILALAALSYLGLGLPNSIPTWGGMLSNGTNVIYDGYWWQLYPAGVAIVLTVVAFNFIGDALRDSLDVRLQRR